MDEFIRDFNETDFYQKYSDLLDALLLDNTTKKNILWCTDNYKISGDGFFHDQQIKSPLITGRNFKKIKPRIEKSKTEQAKRSRNNAEVFTPS